MINWERVFEYIPRITCEFEEYTTEEAYVVKIEWPLIAMNSKTSFSWPKSEWSDPE